MRQSPRSIDLMIVGAQKAGTTSLLRYLGNHSSICIHEKPEILFFLIDKEYQKGYSWAFDRYFGHCADNKKLLFAKNVGIMYWIEAIRRLKYHNPDVNLVVMLRNPVDRAYSAYWYARREGWETLKSFEKAIDAESKRLNKDPFKWRQCAYLDRSFYYKHIQILFEIFKKEQVHIFLYEDFKKDPISVCRQVLSLFNLYLENFNIPSVRFNKSAIAKSELLIRIINTDNILRRIVNKIMSENIKYRIGKKLKKLNQKEFEYPPMNPETKKILIEFFKEPNEKLGMLINRDFRKWNTK